MENGIGMTGTAAEKLKKQASQAGGMAVLGAEESTFEHDPYQLPITHEALLEVHFR